MKSRKRWIPALPAACLLALLCGDALAAHPPKTAKQTETKTAKRTEAKVAPIDDLQEELYKAYKSKRAAQLKKAYDPFAAGKYLTAKKRAASMLEDSEFGDYARWISAQADLQLARAAIPKKHFTEARKWALSASTVLAPVATRYPYTPFLKSLSHTFAEAEMTLGQAACASKKWTSCRTEYENAFQRLLAGNEMGYARPEDLSAYAQACNKNETELCRSWMLRLAQFYPRISEEFKAIVQFFPEYKDRVPRPVASGRLSQNYRSPDPDQVAMDEAMSFYLDGKNKEAIDAFRRFTDEYPRSHSRYRALYWLAQALKKDKKDDEARKLLIDLQKSSPYTYYGLLAGLESGSEVGRTLQEDPPTAADFDTFLHPHEIVHLRRAQHLLAQKAYELAALELRALRAREGLSSQFLVYLAMLHAEAQSYVTAFPILNELLARGHDGALSTFISRMIFPTAELPLVTKFTDPLKLDPVLVLSLMKQESSFDPGAMSPAGAMGLMQLMPTTAVDTVSGLARHELLSAETNVKTGTLYLSKLMSRFQGNMVYAVAGYNAGPGAVNRWIRSAPPGRTMLEFIESIPYKETRDYVSAIIRNYFWYTQKLNPENAKKLNLDFFWHNYGPQISIGAPESTDVTGLKPISLEIPVKSAPTPTASPITAPTPTPSPSAALSPVPAPTPTPSRG